MHKTLVRSLVLSVVLPGAALSWVHCGGTTEGPKGCTLNAVASLTITVKDPAGARVCDATVTATDGAFSEKLMALPGADCVYAGPFERAGTYEVTVTKAGYSTALLRNLVVGSDECHVIPVAATVTLTP